MFWIKNLFIYENILEMFQKLKKQLLNNLLVHLEHLTWVNL